MIFYPKSYFKNILEIDMNFIEKNNIKAILLDIDNTMIDTDNNILEGLEDWVEEAKKHGITKLKWIVPGGKSCQESIRNGVFNLESKLSDDDIVVIHDGIRPLVDESVLTDVIEKCKIHGNAVSSLPYNEQIFIADNDYSTTRYIPRETIRRVATPQAYKFSLLDEKYHEAFEKEIGIYGSSYTNTMMVELGVRLYFASGSDKNIKLTTKDDLEIFTAYLNSKKNK